MYTARVRTAAPAATADVAFLNIWNPSTTQRVKFVSIGLFKTAAGAAGDACRLRRTTARGTSSSSVTPDIESHSTRGIAPPSGLILDLDWSVEPTITAKDLGFGWVAPNVQGAGIVYPIPGGLEIPPGAGIALVQTAAAAWPASDATISWLEDW